MSWSWYLYTTRSPREATEADAEHAAAVEAFFEDHEPNDDDCAEASVGGSPPPSPSAVDASPAILDRLGQCRATVTFDHVRSDPDESPMQATDLRFWLERLAPCVMDWGEHRLELGEDVLARLATMRSRGALGSLPPVKRKAARRRAEKPGETRAVGILRVLEAARGDAELAVDVNRALRGLSPAAERYVDLLVSEGALPDAIAMKRLGLDSEAFREVAEEVASALA